mgnify:FL=1
MTRTITWRGLLAVVIVVGGWLVGSTMDFNELCATPGVLCE